MEKSIVILTGGGPAPGMNTVVGTIAKTFLSNGYRVIGLHGGYKGLFSPTQKTTDIDFLLADSIFNRGGSYLMMSRYKPSQEDFDKNFNLDFFKNNNIQLLVTVGGDDTASTANRIAKFLAAKNYPIANIHVPKTIDNDLPLPSNIPTFGYHSAKSEGTKIATTVYEDARTSGTWFVVSAMGRSAGHLALGIGATCHYPMIVIPEMFNRTDITIDKIVNMAISAIIKRKIMGLSYGAIMISEGVFHAFSHTDLEAAGVKFTYDDHGHPELGKISKAQMFNELLEKKLDKLGISVKSRPVEIGYEVRCVTPIAYDLMYCSQLGMGVYQLFKEGATGCMVYLDLNNNIKPLYLSDIQDKDGKIPPRGVNIHTDKAQNIIRYLMHYITPADYEAAKEYVANPEEYDFIKMLNW
ncbi:MAG: 6-phosphofructokinase [Candidatus Egerieousia sp.]|nr:6-phosphofructokinase [Bacteroidales bacterium]MCI6918886.1 6-phosphofructokinase [bacterium]MDY2650876.1 6-phosphofructokinase [Candidatus Egerieousia sp.]MDD5963657.1 6-phosphofructokinase [bacterium]MDD7072513.1 6-phosphofructokinase [bacterium]